MSMVGGMRGVVTWVARRAEGCWVWRLGLSIDVGELDEDDGWVWSVGNEGGGAWAAWARRADGI